MSSSNQGATAEPPYPMPWPQIPSQENAHEKGPAYAGPLYVECFADACLFRRHLLGLAFLPHQFQLALGGFDLGMHFLLHASRGLFELR